MSIPFLFCAFITAVSAVVSLGFSIAAAFNTANDVRRIALYTCARSVALVLGDRFHETGPTELDACWWIPRLRLAERGLVSWQHGGTQLSWR